MCYLAIINLHICRDIIICKNAEVNVYLHICSKISMVTAMRNYGELLKEHRLAKGVSLLDVERETGIDNSNLSRWEQGKVLPSIYFCEKLADYYGVTLDELIGRDFEKNKND